jgi:two-component sensor histidine kinase
MRMFRYASDLHKIVLYAILALGCVGGFTYLGNVIVDKGNAERNNSVLLRELVHGVANNFAAVAALIQMKSTAVTDIKARSVLDDAIEQVRVMARVDRPLRSGGGELSLDVNSFIQELCDDLIISMRRGRPISMSAALIAAHCTWLKP